MKQSNLYSWLRKVVIELGHRKYIKINPSTKPKTSKMLS